MIPVDQTKFGYPDGNCMSASLASVLQLPLEEVPDLATPDWISVLAAFLEQYGLCPLVSPVPVDGLSIACGLGPRGHLHAVVSEGDEVAHDPHPDRTGLLNVHHYVALVPCPRRRVEGYSAG